MLKSIRNQINETTSNHYAECHNDSDKIDRIPFITVRSGTINQDTDVDLRSRYPWFLEFSFTETAATVTANATQMDFDLHHVRRVARQTLAGVVSLLRDHHQLIRQLSVSTAEDEGDIREWTASILSTSREVINETIGTVSQRQLERTAVVTSNGSISYGQLQQASTALATTLIEEGVGSGCVVPVCMEKSTCLVVAMLAVLKAGAAFLPLDVSFPVERIHQIGSMVDPEIVLASELQGQRLHLSSWKMKIISNEIDATSFMSEPTGATLPETGPDDLAYVCFTSGSTNAPKGCKVSHAAFCSSARGWRQNAKVDVESRILSWSSLAFDVSVLDILNTLMFGGTICMPNDDERINDLVGAFERFAPTHAILTPSASLCLSPAEVPSLQLLILCGEPLPPQVMARWCQFVRVINGYGPTEAAVSSSMEANVAEIARGSIGKPICGRRWVMDRLDSTRPAPVGALGELLIEGPHVGLGYINNAEETARSFIDRPEALDVYCQDRFPAYRSGDIVRYNHDGSLIFCGRADKQVKIRGQRVELAEVERAVDEADVTEGCAVLVEMVRPCNELTQTYLTLFLECSLDDDRLVDETVARVATATRVALASRLPSFMIPVAYLAVNRFPRTSSGKIDRKKLCENVTKEHILGLTNTGRALADYAPSPALDALAEVLDIKNIAAYLHRSFISLGGDSLDAIRLVTKLRASGYGITVAQVLGSVQLNHIVAVCVQIGENENKHDFATLALPSDTIQLAASQCDAPPDAIEHVFPCTPFQESLILASLCQKTAYWTTKRYRLKSSATAQLVVKSWGDLCQYFPILRARMVLLQDQRICQAILRFPSACAVLSQDMHRAEEPARIDAEFDFGDAMVRCFVVRDQHVILQAHHAILDGWNLRAAVHSFDQILSGSSPSPVTDFRIFVTHCRKMLTDRSSQRWWQEYLHSAPSAYSFSRNACSAITESIMTREYSLCWPERSEFTLTSYARAAFGLLIGAHSNTTDVCFGVVGSGRASPVPGVASSYGPTICLTPFRMTWNSQDNIEQVLKQLQDSALAISAVEQVGIENIRSWLPESDKHSCYLSSVLVVQPDDGSVNGSALDSMPDVQPMKLMYDLNIELIPLGRSNLRIQTHYDERTIGSEQALRIMHAIHSIMQNLLTLHASTSIAKALEASNTDKAEIYQRNRVLEPPHLQCVHSLVELSVQELPEKVCVDAHDGSWSYRELWAKSERIARGLANWGVKPQSSVIIVLEKSKWAIATMLAALMQGVQCVPVSAASPQKWINRILKATGAQHFIIAEALLPKLGFSASRVRTPQMLADSQEPLETVRTSPADIAFIMFSSGTTGERECIPPHVLPYSRSQLTATITSEAKGIRLSHSSFCTSAAVHAASLHLYTDSRVLHFSAYTFDHTLFEVFTTLIRGACICVPSETERLSNLAGFITRSRTTWSFITSTVAQVLEPNNVPTLKTLALGGEPIPQQMIEKWVHRLELIVGYGPTECSVCTSGQLSVGSKVGHIGVPTACCGWIVHPDDASILMPCGTIGELLVEGHLLADGYCSDVDLPTNPWLPPQRWLPRDEASLARIYKTGDLVRYNEDGSLQLIGRKDSMVKLHGQRIDLSAVEYHISQKLGIPTVVDVIERQGSGDQQSRQQLACFIKFGESDAVMSANDEVEWLPEAQASENFIGIARDAALAASSALPRFMVPTSYLALRQFPKTPSGKLDRKRLRVVVGCLPDYAFSGTTADTRPLPPGTDAEMLLRKCWSQVLSLSEARIGRNSHFFGLGGDSMSAIRLVALLRQRQVATLTVGQVLMHPELEAQALVCETQLAETAITSTAEVPAPLSLLPNKDDVRADLVRSILESFAIDDSEIEDIYPATPMQEGLWALSTRRPGAYTAKLAFKLSTEDEVKRLLRCWEQVNRSMPILRSTVVTLPGQGTFVVVLKATRPSQALSSVSTDGLQLKWVVHHALYDGSTWDMILDNLLRLWKHQVPRALLPHSVFAQHLQDHAADVTMSYQYWQSEIGQERILVFPDPLAGNTLANASDAFTMAFPRPDVRLSFPLALLIQAAFAMLLRRHANGRNVMFGNVRHGRSADLPGLDLVAGPTIVTVPLHVRIDPTLRVRDLLRKMQQQNLDTIPHEHLGLSNIRACLPHACRSNVDFQTLLIVQSPESRTTRESRALWQAETDERGLESFFTYPLNVLVTPDERNVHVRIQYDPKAMSADSVQRLATHYRVLCTDLANASDEARCADMRLMTTEEERSLVNKIVHEDKDPEDTALQGPLYESISAVAAEKQFQRVVNVWDGSLTYGELSQQADVMAQALQQQGVRRGDTVALYVDKGYIVPLLILAVLRSGARFLLLDQAQPRRVLASQLQQAGTRIVLSASECSVIRRLAPRLVHLDPCRFLDPDLRRPSPHASYPIVNECDDAYVIFTSGTTGDPKGIRVSHRALHTALYHQAAALGLTEQSRVLQYSRYSWDVSILELLAPLLVGAQTCIPPASATLSPPQLERFIQSQNVSFAILTPSVARLLREDRLPSLRQIALTGEPMTDDVRQRWSTRNRLMNCYGPAETTILASVSTIRAQSSPRALESVFGCVLWIVEPDNLERLTPLGMTGELLIEGPIVGSGYLSASDDKHSGFVAGPAWLTSLRGHQMTVYKTGDLAHREDNGTMWFLGRKDHQLKINGQRVELMDVEARVKKALPQLEPAVEAVLDPVDRDSIVLVAFVCCTLDASSDHRSLEELIVPSSEADSTYGFTATVNSARATLALSSPLYMIPRSFVPLRALPISRAGKLDRHTLRTIDVNRFRDTILPLSEDDAPHGLIEQRMQTLWCALLKVPISSLGRDNDFFSVGGDSIKAMQLASTPEYQEWTLNVLDIMSRPTIRAQGALVEVRQSKTQSSDTSYSSSLTPDERPAVLLEQAATILRLPFSEIEDVFPCTPMQSGLLALSARHPGAYWAKMTFKDSMSARESERFRNVWASVESLLPILRTRMFLGDKQEPMQAVLRKGQPIRTKDKNSCLHMPDVIAPECLTDGHPLVHTAFEFTEVGCVFHLTMHHCIFDGGLLQLLSELVEDLFQGKLPAPVAPFRDFIDASRVHDVASCHLFWQSQLSGVKRSRWPPQRADTAQRTDTRHEDSFDLPATKIETFTAATRVRLAWALLLSGYENTSDILFGEVLSGRITTSGTAMRTAGPTITTVPIRVAIPPQSTAADLLNALQRHYIELIPFQQAGLSNIGQMLPDKDKHATHFRTLLIINWNQTLEQSPPNVWTYDAAEDVLQHPYSIVVECNILPSSLMVNILYDSALLAEESVRRIGRQFGGIVSHLWTTNHNVLAKHLKAAQKGEVKEMLSWNLSASTGVQNTGRDLLNDQAMRIKNTVSGNIPTPKPSTIGRPHWIVDPDDHDLLVPVGVVGKLLVELPFDEDPSAGGERSTVPLFTSIPRWSKMISDQRDWYLHDPNKLARYDWDGTLVIESEQKPSTACCKKEYDPGEPDKQGVVVPSAEPLSPIALKLLDLWYRVLSCDPGCIRVQDNFFRSGGNSISAMRLASSARGLGISLTVVQIFQHPTLKEMAAVSQVSADLRRTDNTGPFTLIPPLHRDYPPRLAAELCGVVMDDIEDIYPCTMVQKGMMAASGLDRNAYMSVRNFKLPQELDMAKFFTALVRVIQHRPILRTRIIDLGSLGAYQAVLRSTLCRPRFASADQETLPSDTVYGNALNEFVILDDTFIWTAHHATYDAHTQSAVEREIVQAYQSRDLSSGVPLRDFVSFLLEDIDESAANIFWRTYLAGTSPMTWPVLCPSPSASSIVETVTHVCQLPPVRQAQYTDFTHVKLAWSLLLSQYMGSSNVLYATTLSGRDTALHPTRSVLGPTMTTVPVRVECDPARSIGGLMADVQATAADLLRFQHTGLARIRNLVRHDVPLSTKAMTLLVHQDASLGSSDGLQLLNITECESSDMYQSDFPLVMISTLRADTGEFQLRHDPESLSRDEVVRISRQFAHILSRLRTADPRAVVGQLDLVSPEERSILAEWAGANWCDENVVWPLGRLELTAQTQPTSCAVDGWDGKMTYRELWWQSANMAQYLATLGVEAGSIVAMCFHKSKLVMTVVFALWRLGAAFTPLDYRDPAARLQELARRVDAKLVLTNIQGWHKLLPNTVCLVTGISAPDLADHDIAVRRHLNHDNITAYIMYTSGSTGEPKGVVMSQGALAAWAMTAGAGLQLDGYSRTLQSTRYTFDPSIAEIVGTLYHGGCVCIPSEDECLDCLMDVASRYEANLVQMTPSVLRMQPVPRSLTLRRLILGGELLDLSNSPPWLTMLPVHNCYGPTEACIVNACGPVDVSGGRSPNLLPRPFVGKYWIVTLNNPTLLVPIGCLGELCIEGPMLSDGYWRDSDKTSAAFLEVPISWPLLETANIVDRKKRLYRTGDLARHLTDGSLHLYGRIDHQVKISGQRIELSEAEFWFTKALAVRSPDLQGIVDFVPYKDATNRRLTVFVMLEPSKTVNQEIQLLADQSSADVLRRSTLLTNIRKEMQKNVPAHMIPSCLLHVSQIPLTTHGKRDRKRLASWTMAMTLGDAMCDTSDDCGEGREIHDERERELLALWKETLGRPGLRFGSSSSFYELGGDSMAAMRLVALARRRGFSIRAADILRTPGLRDMARLLMPLDAVQTGARPPVFGLLHANTVEQIRIAVQSQHHHSWSMIDDAYPLTPMQAFYLSLSLRCPGDGIAQFCFTLKGRNIEVARVQASILHVRSAHEALRTRFVRCSNRCFQVSCSRTSLAISDCSIYSTTLADAQNEEAHAMASILQTASCRFAIALPEDDSNTKYLLFTAHHSVYDGWSLRNLVKAIQTAYKDPQIIASPAFSLSQIVQDAVSCRHSRESASFWLDELADAVPRPLWQTANEQVCAGAHLRREWRVSPTHVAFTLSTMLHVALAIALQNMTGSPRPVLATTLTGRGSNAPGIHSFIGAAVTLVPLCVILQDPVTNEKAALPQVMRQVQDFLNSSGTHHQFGYDEIAGLTPTTKAACASATHLTVHPLSFAGDGPDCEEHNSIEDSQESLSLSLTHARLIGKEREILNIDCTPTAASASRDGNVGVEIRYDDRWIRETVVQDLMENFEVAFRRCVTSLHVV